MILFKTTTSVFELLWDIALAFFIIRIAFVYFSLAFITGCLIAYFRISRFIPLNHLTQPQAELITLLLWLLAIIFWARVIIVSYEIPRIGGFRLAVGLLALGFMLLAELTAGVLMYEEGWSTWIWETDSVAACAGALVLLLFALMPLILMILEKEVDEIGGTYHGAEKKSIIAAVPIVAKVEKANQNEKDK